MAVVYGLMASDRQGVIRYVGQTKHPAEWRLRRHVEAAHSVSGPHFPVHDWINAVERRGAVVEVIVLINEAIWNVDEIAQIDFCRRNGIALLNCTAGGDGHLDASKETRAKLSAAHLGKSKSTKHRAALSASQKMRLADPVVREEQRLRHVGKKRSATTRSKLSGENNSQAKMNADLVARMRREHAAGDVVAVIAARHDVKYGTCYAAVKGLTWQTL